MIIGLLIIALLLFQIICYGYWWLRAWSEPDQYSVMIDRVRKLPSETVIKKLHSFQLGNPYPFIALKVLVERKEEKATPALLKQLKSWNKGIRRDAIWALGIINDERTIKPLMDIINNGEKNSNYSDALMALARMKYNGAFPYVVKLAKDKDAVGNGSIAMLREFGKPEGIPLLLDIKNRIRNTDPLAKFDKSQIDDAIKHIESLQKAKEGNSESKQ